jgi:HK97 family phage portal protein
MRQGLRPRSDLGWLLGDWTPPTGPVPATEAEAMGLPPFGRSVAIVASAIASTPLRAFREEPDLGVAMRLSDQPSFLTDPDPQSTPWGWKYATVSDLILYGNSVGIPGDVDWRTGRPGWVIPVPAEDVWLLVDPDGMWWFTIGGEAYRPQDLWHVSAGNRSGEPLGLGVLAEYGLALGGAVSVADHAGAYFAGGALPPAVLQAPEILTEPQAAQLKAKWRTVANTREPIVMPMGYVLTPLVSNAEQAQLVESRQWNAAEVAMMVGAPWWLLGLEGPQMTYLNLEGADISLVRDYLARWADPISAAATKWMLPNGTDARWDWASRMRADQATTATVLGELVTTQIITIDEARAVLGRPPLMSTVQAGTTPAGVPELTPQEAT